MTLDELLELPRAQLTKEVIKAASDKERRMAFVECVCELKRLRDSQGGGAARLPQPGLVQLQDQAA